MSGPVNGEVNGLEPRKSKDDILSATAHDIEEMFLDNPFNISVKSTSIADCTSFVCSPIYIVNGNGGGKFFSGELVFSDELPVNTGDICARIYQCRGVDDFEDV